MGGGLRVYAEFSVDMSEIVRARLLLVLAGLLIGAVLIWLGWYF